MPHDTNPSETSPLLSKPDKSVTGPIEPGDGIVPNGTLPTGAAADGAIIEGGVADRRYGTAGDDEEDDEEDEDGEENVDGGDIERQVSNENRQKQYEGRPEVRKRMKVILPALAIGIFLSAADQTIIVSSYGRIGSELKALSNTSWVATAYFLTLTSFQPLYGKLSDIFSRKSCLLFGYLVFGLGCLFCGVAKDMKQLILARAFAGIGGGAMTTVVSIFLSDTVPLRERGKYQGYVNIIYATGAATGAPLGGIMADYVGWRWAFLFQAPLCLAAFLAVFFALNEPNRDDSHLDASHWKAKLRRIDFLGAAILVSAVSTLLLGLDRGSNVSWNATITIASLSVSLPLFCIFMFVEIRVATEPFAPGHIIFDRSLFASYLCNFFSFSGWLAALFYIPLYFQAVDGLSATQAGVRLIPAVIAGVSGSLSAGFYMQKTGKYYWLTVVAYSTLVLGVTLVLLFSGVIANSYLGMCVGMMFAGFSNGIGVTTSLVSLIANASRKDQAVATACSYLFRSLGSVFGVSLSATVANQALRAALQKDLNSGKDAQEIVDRVRESLSYIKTLEPHVRSIVRDCYAKSTRAAFGLQIVIVLGAAISAWWMREKALSR